MAFDDFTPTGPPGAEQLPLPQREKALLRAEGILRQLRDKGLSGEQAFELLLRARRAGHPIFKKVPGLSEYIDAQTGLGSRFASAAVSGLVTPFAYLAQPFAGRDVYEEASQMPSRVPGGPRIPIGVPILGGAPYADVLGGIVGSMVPFMGGEAVVSPFVDILAAKAIPGALAAARIGEVTPALARAERIAQIAKPTIAGAGIGYTYNENLGEAAVGGAMGMAGGMLHNVLAKPLAGVKDPQVSNAIKFIARWKHESPEAVVGRLKTVADLQAELAKAGQQPVDVTKLAGQQIPVKNIFDHPFEDVDRPFETPATDVFGPEAFPPQGGEKRLYKGKTEPLTSEELFPIVPEPAEMPARWRPEPETLWTPPPPKPPEPGPWGTTKATEPLVRRGKIPQRPRYEQLFGPIETVQTERLGPGAYAVGDPVNFKGVGLRGTVAEVLPDSLVVEKADGTQVRVTGKKLTPFEPTPEERVKETTDIFKKVEKAKPETVSVEVPRGGITAMRLNDGRVIADVRDYDHGHLLMRYMDLDPKLNPDDVESTGFVRGDKYYFGERMEGLARDPFTDKELPGEPIPKGSKIVRVPKGQETVEDLFREIAQHPAEQKAERARQRELKKKLKVSFRDRLANESGALFPDSKSVARSDRIVLGADFDPTKVFGDSESVGSLVNEMRRHGVFSFLPDLIRTPGDIFADHPQARSWYFKHIEYRERLDRIRTTLRRRAGKVLENHDITTPERFEQLIPVLKDTYRRSDGLLVQRTLSSDPSINAAARLLRNLDDRAYRIVSGIDARAAAILHELGFETRDTKAWARNVRRIEAIQRGESVSARNLPELKRAAELTKGLIDTKYKDPITYESGHFSHFPLENQAALLADDIAKHQLRLDSGLLDPHMEALEKAALERRQKALEALKKQVTEREQRDLPRPEGLPQQQWSGTFSITKNPAAKDFGFETNLDKYFDTYYNRFFYKATTDHLLSTAREYVLSQKITDPLTGKTTMSTPKIDDPQMRAAVKSFIDVQRGIEQLHNDAWMEKMSRFLAQELKLDVKPEQLKRMFDEATTSLLKFNSFTKVLLSPRFYAYNMMEPLTNIQPFVGWRAFGKALAELLPMGKTAASKRAWSDVLRHGTIEEGGGFLTGEKEGHFMQGMSKVGHQQHLLNQAIAYRAFFHAAEDPRFRARAEWLLPSYYVDPATSSFSIRDRQAIGRAGARETIFNYGRAVTPRAITSSRVGKLMLQFKQYGLRYGIQFQNAVNLARKTKDFRPLADMVANWAVTGGLKALTAPATVATAGLLTWDVIRNGVLKVFGSLLPEQSLAQGAMQAIGLGFTSPIDITASMNPLLTYSEPFQYPYAILGPTFGTIPSVATAMYQAGETPMALGRGLKALAPSLAAAGEAVTELAKGRVDAPYSRKVIAHRPWWQAVGRGVNLQPSVRSQYVQTRNLIKSAIRGGQGKALTKLIAEARAKGLIFTGNDLQQIRQEVRTEQRKQARFEHYGMGEVFR